MFSVYYVGKILKNKIWFVTGSLKSEDNWVFIKTLKSGDLEFFIAPDFESDFLRVMELFKAKGLVLSLEKLNNRFIEAS